MRLEVMAGTYAVCRLPPGAPWPAADGDGSGASFHCVTRTEAELSVVCEERLAPQAPGHDRRVERGFRLLRVAGPLPFDAVGVLASLTAPLAAAKVSLFSVSTFDTDYLLLREADLETALGALRAAGHEAG
jgi:hypothetical protein